MSASLDTSQKTRFSCSCSSEFSPGLGPQSLLKNKLASYQIWTQGNEYMWMRVAWKVMRVDRCLSTCRELLLSRPLHSWCSICSSSHEGEYTDPLCLWRRDSGSGTCWSSLHRRWQSGYCEILPACAEPSEPQLSSSLMTSFFFFPSLSSVFHLAVNIKDALLEGGPSLPTHLAALTVALAALPLLLSFPDRHPLLVHRLPRSRVWDTAKYGGKFLLPAHV